MPTMDNHESNDVVKMLVAADSGAGKTGALASLVDAGLHLHILDFDNGLSPLKNYVKDKSKLANVGYETLVDELQLIGGRFTIKKANAFQRAMELFDKGAEGWGPPVKEMTAQDVLVVDTLGTMGKSALYLVMQVNGAMAKSPELQHYGAAMDNIEKMLAQLMSNRTKCHVIVNTHLMQIEGSVKLYPESLGSKLGPKIAKAFDNFFSISMTGVDRTIKTSKDAQLALKCAKALPDEYKISDGYAKIFRELTGVKDLSTLGQQITA